MWKVAQIRLEIAIDFEYMCLYARQYMMHYVIAICAGVFCDLSFDC